MPGLTNRRRAIQEGQDWTKSSKSKKVKGYRGGGMTTPMMGYSKGGITGYKKKDRRP